MKRDGFRSFAGVPALDGFTLVEMLIALAIFGMITAAGVALLGLTVRTQQISERLLDATGAVRRTGALLTADLAQAAPRISRDAEGRARPAFTGGAGDGEVLMALVRRGGDEAAAGRASLERVEYRLREGRIERWRYGAVDGGAPAVAAPLLDGVNQVRLRYRDRNGEWRVRWDPTDAAQLPVAVELTANSAAQGTIRQLFLVAAGR